jgi:hypothetical protein
MIVKRNRSAGRTLQDVIATLPASERRAIAARTDELVTEELDLQALRKTRKLTQSDVANALEKRQDEVCRIEQREDMLLSTLTAYVRSLGGELELVARFKDRAPVRLKTWSPAEPSHRRVGASRNARRN